VSSNAARAATIIPMSHLPDWTVVVPVKGGAGAKSRLHPPAGVARTELALALAADCLAACVAGMPPGRVLVVTSDEHVRLLAAALGVRCEDDPGGGLDAAVRAGVAAVDRSSGGTAPVAVLLGDLPALRPHDLVTALAAAAAYDRAVVPDTDGTGTVLLTSLSAAGLEPSFGPGSAARHVAGGATRLQLDLPSLRTDVDDDLSLAAALDLGVGPATGRVLAAAAR
jgi:2-phospho-L-lactate/phosphoenolpyruvate guanylyltransferase